MKIEVYHSGVHVANVLVLDPAMNVEDALEYAWRWTNNVEGSWSRKEKELPGYGGGMEKNGDYNENVEVVAPLPTHLGRTYGHRSSMVGDIFKVDGVPYVVASSGFKKVEEPA